MKNIINNKKGSISIIGVIITIIIVTTLAGYLSIMNSSWVFNEVQSIMDLCATNALQQSIDSKALRKEILGVNNTTNGSSDATTSIDTNGNGKVSQAKITSLLRPLYENELKKNIKVNASSGGLITAFEIKHFKADLVYSSWGANYNGVAKKRPQLRLDAVTQITIKADSQFDGLNNYKLDFYNAKTSNNDIKITVNGVTGDGRVILTVRTLSRMLYK